MTWSELSSMLVALWHAPEVKLLAGLVGLAGGAWVAYLARDPGDRYADYEGDRP